MRLFSCLTAFSLAGMQMEESYSSDDDDQDDEEGVDDDDDLDDSISDEDEEMADGELDGSSDEGLHEVGMPDGMSGESSDSDETDDDDDDGMDHDDYSDASSEDDDDSDDEHVSPITVIVVHKSCHSSVNDLLGERQFCGAHQRNQFQVFSCWTSFLERLRLQHVSCYVKCLPRAREDFFWKWDDMSPSLLLMAVLVAGPNSAGITYSPLLHFSLMHDD